MLRRSVLVLAGLVFALALFAGPSGASSRDCDPGSGPDLHGQDLTKKGSDLPDDLTCANLRGAKLDGRDLTQKEMAGADATGASFVDSTLTQADLQGAILQNADFTEAKLDQATMTDADLTSAILKNADLTQTDLRHATLKDADVSGAKQTQVQVDGADISGLKGVFPLHLLLDLGFLALFLGFAIWAVIGTRNSAKPPAPSPVPSGVVMANVPSFGVGATSTGYGGLGVMTQPVQSQPQVSSAIVESTRAPMWKYPVAIIGAAIAAMALIMLVGGIIGEVFTQTNPLSDAVKGPLPFESIFTSFFGIFLATPLGFVAFFVLMRSR